MTVGTGGNGVNQATGNAGGTLTFASRTPVTAIGANGIGALPTIGVTFNMSGGSAVGLADATGLTAIPSFTPTLGSAKLSIKLLANGCSGTPINYTITINPIITPAFNSVAAICSGGILSPLPTN